MTANQLRAVEWAVERSRFWLMPTIDGSDIDLGELREKHRKARRALAAAWSEYRAARIARRTAPLKRDLQRVRTK